MKYVKYIVIFIFFTTLNCSLKKPVEGKKENKDLLNEISLKKDRGTYPELFAENETHSEITYYIEAIGDVWDYDDDHIKNLNIGDSLGYSAILTGYVTSDTGFDHIAVLHDNPYDGPPFGYSIYKVGIYGTNKYMRISWLDDRYYTTGLYQPPNGTFDIWAVYDGNLKIRYWSKSEGEYITEVAEDGQIYHIWNTLIDDDETSVSLFDGNLSKVTGTTISGPDSLGTDQSGNFTATHAPGGRELQFLEYKWEVKKGNGSYNTLDDWSLLDSTTSYAANMNFTLRDSIWDLVHDVMVSDTHLVKVDPYEITGVDLDGPTSLDPDEEGEFTADVTPSYRATYEWYIDYDWSVMYLDEPPKKKKEERLRLPPTNEWLDLDQWDGYQTIDFSSGYYSFRLKVIVTDEYYSSTKYDTLDVVVSEK